MSLKPFFLSPKLNRFILFSTINLLNSSQKSVFRTLLSSNNTDFPLPRSEFVQFFSSLTNPNPKSLNWDFDNLCTALQNPNLAEALEKIQIEPSPSLLLAVFKRFDSSPKQVFSLFKWAEKQSGYNHNVPIFNSMVNILAKSGEFKWALMVLLNEIKINNGSELISAETLGFLVRNYARLGMSMHAIRLYEFAGALEIDLFAVLLDGLCKYGHVKVACDCIDRKMYLDPDWVPSVDVYNMLLEGWFRLRDLNKVEQLLLQMRRENLVPEAATYGILVGGYCRMGLVDRAVELLGEMRREGLTPSRRVYDPLVDTLSGRGRLKEALGILERFLVLEAGPTLTTYNALIRGFCKVGDLDGAGKILKMMSSRGIVPTATTYNNFFRYFVACGKIDEGVDLYRKMIESGYKPDGMTFHLLLSMLCEVERLELIIKIREDMRTRGHSLNSDMSDVLIHLFCKTCRFNEAVMELEEVIQRGFIPNLASCQTLHTELKRKGLHEVAIKVSNIAATIPCSKPSPTALVGAGDVCHHRRQSIIQKAKAMSNTLKTSSDPREIVKTRRTRKKKVIRTAKG